jgi:20S proteasome alpha/beta subunit
VIFVTSFLYKADNQGDSSKVSQRSFSSGVLKRDYVSVGRILTNLVEYAMEAISHAGTVLAVASKEGIAMAAEKVSQLALSAGRQAERNRKSPESSLIYH